MRDVRFKRMDDFQDIARIPTEDEFIRLRKAVGWHVPHKESAHIALSNSLFSVCILRQGECVGCGRVVGDGSLVFHIQDVMVLPQCQRNGCGTRIMDVLMEYINRSTEPTAYIALFSSPGLEPWYSRYGFVRRPTGNLGPGMAFFMT